MFNTQKPLSALNTTDELAPTQANFPALQHFFPFDEASGATTITDSVGGVVITPDSLTVDGTKASVITCGADTALTSGSWAAAGTNEVLMCVMGTWTDAGTYDLAIGSQAGAGVRYRMFETVRIFDDGTTNLTDTTDIADGTDAIAYMYSDTTSATKGIYTGTAAAAGDTAVGGTGDGTAQVASLAAPSDLITLDTFTNVYGIAIFHFATTPIAAEVSQALLWMRNEWAVGNKTIYPGWKNVA